MEEARGVVELRLGACVARPELERATQHVPGVHVRHQRAHLHVALEHERRALLLLQPASQHAALRGGQEAARAASRLEEYIEPRLDWQGAQAGGHHRGKSAERRGRRQQQQHSCGHRALELHGSQQHRELRRASHELERHPERRREQPEQAVLALQVRARALLPDARRRRTRPVCGPRLVVGEVAVEALLLRQRLAAEASDEQRQQPEHDEARSRQCGLCQERLREFHWPIPTPA